MTVAYAHIGDWNGWGSEAPRVFRILAGRWRFHRVIPGIASLAGQAVFAPTMKMPTSLRYEERGELRLESGATYAAARRYLYRHLGARIVIEFADGANRGAVLHDMSFAASCADARVLTAHHRHSCWPDNYDLEMRVTGNDRFESHYRIAGPRKNYEMHTVYQRERHETRSRAAVASRGAAARSHVPEACPLSPRIVE